MVNTAALRVRDIPGEIGDDVRLFVVERFMEIGFLELAEISSMVGAARRHPPGP